MFKPNLSRLLGGIAALAGLDDMVANAGIKTLSIKKSNKPAWRRRHQEGPGKRTILNDGGRSHFGIAAQLAGGVIGSRECRRRRPAYYESRN